MILSRICKVDKDVFLDFYEVINCCELKFGHCGINCINIFSSQECVFFLELSNIDTIKNTIYHRKLFTIEEWFSLNDDIITEKYKELKNDI